MRRLHAIAISILLGAGIAAGAAASLRTVHLGAAAAATQTTVSGKTVSARRTKLAAWSASLRKARAARPPALPRVPHYAPVSIPTMPPIRQAAAETQTTVVRHVAESPPAAPSPATPSVAQAEPQVTYVQPPPVVQYQQAPASTTPTTTTSGNEDEDYEDHGESSEHEDGWNGGSSGDVREADD